MTSKRRTTLLLLFVFAKKSYFHIFDLGIDFNITLSWNWPWSWHWITKIILQMDFSAKSPWKRGITHFPSFICYNLYFLLLGLEIYFWPWRWPSIIKIVFEMDCPVKITWKWGITLFLSLISWKIIYIPSIYKNAKTFQAGTHRISIPHP